MPSAGDPAASLLEDDEDLDHLPEPVRGR